MTATRSNILLVDDDPGFMRFMAGLLDDAGDRRFAIDGRSALRMAHEQPPDLVLLDADMPGMSGYQVCEALKRNPALADVPVIFVSSHHDRDFELAALRAGADDFIAKPLDAETFRARVLARLRLKGQLDGQRLRVANALASLPRRPVTFDEELDREWRRAVRDGTPISMVLVALNPLNRWLAPMGAGTAATSLCRVAEALQRVALRPADRLAALAPDRHVLLLPQTPRAGAVHVGRAAMKALGLLLAQDPAGDADGPPPLNVGLSYFDDRSPHWPAHRCEGAPTARLAAQLDGRALLHAAEVASRAAAAAGRGLLRCLDLGDGGRSSAVCEPEPSEAEGALHLSLRPLQGNGSVPDATTSRSDLAVSPARACGAAAAP